MPLQRRLPKRGFTNIFKKEWIEVNLADLDQRFEPSDNITPELMVERGMIKKGKLNRYRGVVVLGKGKLTKALSITANRFSEAARQKIEAAGGVATFVSPTVEARQAGSDE
jgi:large subunit ribosomal protein L15